MADNEAPDYKALLASIVTKHDHVKAAAVKEGDVKERKVNAAPAPKKAPTVDTDEAARALKKARISSGSERLNIKLRDKFFYLRYKYVMDNWPEYEETLFNNAKKSRPRDHVTKEALRAKCQGVFDSCRKVAKGLYALLDVLYQHGEGSTVGRMYGHGKLKGAKKGAKKGGKKGEAQYKFGWGLWNLPRALRHTIALGLYWDLDFVNAMPTLMWQWAVNHNMKLPVLARYVPVEGRKEMLAELEEKTGMEFSAGKALVCAFFDGGSIPHDIKDKAPEWLHDIYMEIRAMMEIAKQEEPEMWELGQKKAKAKCDRKRANGVKNPFYNPEGSMMSLLYGELENQCLMAMYDWLVLRGFVSAKDWEGDLSLIFDGMMVLITAALVKHTKEQLLIDLAAAVLDKTGYTVIIVEKEMKEGLDIPSDAELEAMALSAKCVGGEDDGDDDGEEEEDGDGPMAKYVVTHYEQEAAPILVESLGDRFVYSEKLYYVKQESGIWTNDQNIVDAFLLNYTIKLGIELINEKGNQVPYSGRAAGARAIIAVAKAMKTSDGVDGFYEYLMNSARGKIFFKNGYWISSERRFVEGFEGVDTLTCINRDFPARDEAMIADVKMRLLVPVLGPEDGEVYRSTMHIKARALAGVREKMSLCVLGERNSGKSKVQEAMREAARPYVVIINANVLLASHTTGDGNRDSVVFIETETARLVMATEVKSVGKDTKPTVMNGDLIKVWQTPGDTTRARDVSEKSREVKIQSLLCISGNKMPRMVPADAYEEQVSIRVPNKFVSDAVRAANPFNTRLLKADPSIDQYIKRQDVADALLHIMLDAYTDERFDITKYPQLVEWRECNLVEGNDNVLDKYFDFTAKKEDMVLVETVSKVLTTHDIPMNMEKFEMEWEKKICAKLERPTAPFKIVYRPKATEKGAPRPRFYCGLKCKIQPRDE